MTRPSQILGLDDYRGYQLDSAMAIRHDLIDKDFFLDTVQELITAIILLAKVMGAKKAQLPKRKKFITNFDEEEPSDEMPTVQDVLSSLGGKSVKIELGGKK